ncbi:MAG TPA: hypothetical protein VMB21_10095, partial [Candidatus Limnocylindria bacterium]|nr:hypothetical protein [Candidatus Limnocylindria bacterium]
MSSKSLRHLRCFILGVFVSATMALRAAEAVKSQAWQAIRDDVFLQEVGRQVVTAEPLTAVAAQGDRIFVGSAKG